MSLSNLTPEAEMEIVRVILAVEVVLAVLTLVVAGIRAFGPSMAKRWLSKSINATARTLHIY
jgi:hypothetical protein